MLEFVMGVPVLMEPELFHYTDYYTFGKLSAYQINDDLAIVLNENGNVVGIGINEEFAKADAWARMVMYTEEHLPYGTMWHYEFV